MPSLTSLARFLLQFCPYNSLTFDLRAWEKRYGAVNPVRSAGGQRHYTDENVARLQLLVRATRGGRQIGQVGALPNTELQRIIEADERPARRDQRRAPSSFSIVAVLGGRDARSRAETFSA